MTNNGGTIEIQDRVSDRLNRITDAMNRLVNSSRTLDNAMGRAGDVINAPAQQLDRTYAAISAMSSKTAQAVIKDTNSISDTMNDLDLAPQMEPITVPIEVDNLALPKIEELKAIPLQFDSSAIDNFALPEIEELKAIPLSFDSSALDNFSLPQFEKVPIEFDWQNVEQPEVFMTDGVERYQQELNGVNDLLQRASQSQAGLNAQASSLNFASGDVMADFDSINTRLQQLTGEMARIEANPIDDIVSASVNSELESLRSSLLSVIKTQEDVSSGLNDMDLGAANKATNQLSTQLTSVERQVRQNTSAQGQFNESLDGANVSSNRLLNTVRNIGIALGASKIVSSAINLSDTYSQTNARIDMMNDGLQTTALLQQAIFQAAENSRAEYQATADLVGKLGTLAGDAFGSSAEVVHFAELLNKQFAIAGTSAQEAAGATHQLTQALASGVLRGDELNSVMEQAPTIIQSIADYLGVTKGEIRALAAEGELSADIVKNAMFAAADDINAKFESMPKTWASLWTSFKNNALEAFEPLFALLNELANSAIVQNIMQHMITNMYIVADVTTRVLQMLGSLGNFISEHWGIIAPVVYAAATALGIYTAALIIYKTHLMITAGIEAISNLAKAIGAARTMMLAGATFIATAAQHGFNAALLASPITWVVIGLLAIVAALYGGVAMWNHFTGASVSATGIIVGALYVLWDVIMNIFIGIANIALGAVQFVVNLFQAGLYLVELAWFALKITAALVLFAVLAVVQGTVNLIGQIFMAGLYLVQLVWHGLKMAVALILFGILFLTQSAVNGIGQAFVGGANAWNLVWFGFKMYVGESLAGMLDYVSNFLNSAIDGFNDLKYAAEKVWYNIASAAGSMASAIAQGIDGMINSVIGGIEDMLNSVLGGINKMISALDKIPGVNIGSIGEVSLTPSNFKGKVDSFTSSLKAPTTPGRAGSDIQLGDALRGQLGGMEAPEALEWNPVDFTSDMQNWILNQEAPEAKQWENIDLISGLQQWIGNQEAPEAPEQWSPEYFDFKNLADAWDRGYGAGEGLGDKLGGMLDQLRDIGGGNEFGDLASLFDNMPEVPSAPDLSGAGGGSGSNPTGGKLDSIGKIEDDITLEDDFRELLIEHRNRKYQQNFITMTPTITNHVEITTDEEYEDFIKKFNDDVADAIYDGMDGVPTS